MGEASTTFVGMDVHKESIDVTLAKSPARVLANLAPASASAQAKTRKLRVVGDSEARLRQLEASRPTGAREAMFPYPDLFTCLRSCATSLLVAAVLAWPGAARAQETEPSTVGAEDEDPTKTMVFNLRYEHRELLDGGAADLVLLRRDVAIRGG